MAKVFEENIKTIKKQKQAVKKLRNGKFTKIDILIFKLEYCLNSCFNEFGFFHGNFYSKAIVADSKGKSSVLTIVSINYQSDGRIQ